MKFYALGLVSLLLVCVPVAKKLPPGPRIVSNTTYKVADCRNEDPLGTCEGERLVMENPTLYRVVAKVSCGAEFDEQEVNLPPRSRYTVDIELTLPVRHPACRMVSWLGYNP